MASYKMFFRCSEDLKHKIEEAAKRNKWDMSKQVRATLEKVYGTEPYIPGFPGPTQESSSQKPRKRRKAV